MQQKRRTSASQMTRRRIGISGGSTGPSCQRFYIKWPPIRGLTISLRSSYWPGRTCWLEIWIKCTRSCQNSTRFYKMQQKRRTSASQMTRRRIGISGGSTGPSCQRFYIKWPPIRGLTISLRSSYWPGRTCWLEIWIKCTRSCQNSTSSSLRPGFYQLMRKASKTSSTTREPRPS